VRILLVEDDKMLGAAMRDHLAAHGHAVDWMTRRADADDARASQQYHVILLDLGLPDGSGLELLRTLRREGDRTPVLILTALDQLSSRIEGLNAGADDYLVKPFDLGELMARLGAVVRRYGGNPNPRVVVGPLSIDLAEHSAMVGSHLVDLSAREWAVLERLAQRPGLAVSKAQLEDALFAFGAEVESNAVEVYVSRLRKKLGVKVIHTLRGLGYRLGTD
jgi:two-component system OmpR family response regulator